MINKSKSTKRIQFPQGFSMLPSNNNIHFFGIRKSKEVLWIRNGATRYFNDLPSQFFNLLEEAYFKDTKAVEFLTNVTDRVARQVELFTYYMYGDLNNTPDIVDGKLARCNNFRDKQECPSLHWNSKNIKIENHILTARQLLIIDLIGENLPDKAIASALNISQKTFDFHKRNLFKALGINTKMELLKLSIQHKIIA